MLHIWIKQIHSFLPDQTNDKELCDLVKLYHAENITQSNVSVAAPLDQPVDILEDSKILAKRTNISSKVKQYIDEFLNPGKASSVDNLTVDETLKFLNIAKVDYNDALSISPASDFEIHLRRTPNSCFINNYNLIMLKVWRTNMDLQPVFNCNKAVSYMSAFFIKIRIRIFKGPLTNME